MKVEQLERANELSEIILSTEKGLDNLKKIRDSIREARENRHFDDGLFSLNISKNRDGSGESANFNRYLGNAELLDTIIVCVEKQLAVMLRRVRCNLRKRRKDGKNQHGGVSHGLHLCRIQPGQQACKLPPGRC